MIKKTERPELFTLNHNGVTLAVERLDLAKGQATFKVPRLLNGAQTITSVAKFLEDNQDHPSLKDGQDRLAAVRVLAKIVVDDPFGPLVTRVTICNNQQNPVHPWNLRANDRIQVDLQDEFLEAGLYYQRQENSLEGLTEDDLEEMGIDDDRPINIRPLAQTFLATQGEVPYMSRLREVFEEQKLYEGTFRRSYLSADVAAVVLAYKVGLMLNPVMRHLEEKAPQWLSPAVRKARNLVWALLVQGILNDPKLENNKESWGKNLKRDRDFAEYLATLAANRVLPLLRDAFGEDAYKSKLAEGRFEFVHTKETYRRCMSAAETRYKWRKASF